MTRRIIVFFSWQSDSPGNHSKMKSGLEKACRKLSKEFGCEIKYDESTCGEPGSPTIEDVIKRKIDDCDVFVADATPVAEHNGKQMPNSNVLYELGHAHAVHPYQRIVILAAKGDWEIKNLPFDFNHSVIIPVDINDSDAFYRLIKGSVRYALDAPETIFSHNDSALYSDLQIQKNVNSGKYLPDTFLDNRELKEHLRYFVDPFLFSGYVASKVYRFNFYRLNRGRKIWGKSKFNFNAKQFQIDDSGSDFTKLYDSINRLRDYVQKKTDELYNNSNEEHLNSTKCKRRIVDLSFLRSQMCLLTGGAGQGKTNFICDFVQNVLFKRHIPYVYLNGFEIDAADIEKTFAKTLCPKLDISFEKMMEQLSLYCSSRQKPILFVIDGLNENPHPEEFSRALAGFLKRILAYDFCKVLMTCRSEYLDENFKELTSTFKKEMLVERNIYQHILEEEKQRLLGNYFRYFEISASVTGDVERTLTDNLLLLRIFCEANRGKCLGRISHIRRDELFDKYYSCMLSRVADAPDWQGRRTFREKKIKFFFMAILKRMIDSETFFNVPLDELLDDMSQEDEDMLLRFLDENILLRKDLSKEDGGIASKEVINFTYDAFRDFLLAHYILDQGDVEKQKLLIGKMTADGHQLKEGITPFLFVHAKNSVNSKLLDFLKGRQWYSSVFDNYVWEVKEDMISDDDIDFLKKRLVENPAKIADRLIYRGRWNTEEHPRLNIKILLNHLEQLDDVSLAEWMEKACSTTKRKGFWGYSNPTEREAFVDIAREQLDDTRFFEYKDSQLFFEYVAYVASVSDNNARNIYLRYIKQSGNINQVQQIARTTRCERLRNWMNQIIAGR